MWSVTVSPVFAPTLHFGLTFSKQKQRRHRPPIFLPVSATSQPSHRRQYSSLNKEHKQQNQGEIQKRDADAKVTKTQLSGLDVLWAMQKAAAEKTRAVKTKKKGKRFEGGGGGVSRKEEESVAVDYSSVRPLCIKTDWGGRLDRLEKRIQILSQTK
ncbi:uncharacterized protein LOC126688005 [Mercurialis annua]|uniref:uncharacterized protein LOC126688005 n=1 Tax=Mercurialis annua TaxID=3986 RepID=UPI00215ED655|nr:uncharacterized protein LOC126688005 [Mercurialis annua]